MSRGKRESVWRGRLAEQRRSGLSIAEYCRRQGFSQPSFYAWRKRLRGKRSIASRTVRQQVANDRRGPANSALFVPITLAAAAASGVRLELSCGAVLTVPLEASAELVTTAIRAALGTSPVGTSPVGTSLVERPAC